MNSIRIRQNRAEAIRANRDSGFSMTALVIFLTAASILLTISVPSYVMQAKREKEKELIFRGEEYARAIEKYQRTLNLLPTSVEELLSSNGTRFLRKAYADPVTGEPWRVIVLNSDGTLTGSNIYQNMGQVPTTTSVRNTAPATPAAGAGTARGGSGGASIGSLGTTNPLTGAGTASLGGGGGAGLGGAGGGLGGAGTGLAGAAGAGAARPATTGPAPATGAPAAQPQQAATPLTGIVGIGSASKGPSVMVHDKQEQYSNWEFIAVLQQRNVAGAGGGGGGAQTPRGGAGGGGGNPAPASGGARGPATGR